MNNLIHIDLFSGIGGFALAAQWAGFETKVFCEIDPFCQKVLKKHWPNVPVERMQEEEFMRLVGWELNLWLMWRGYERD